MKRVDLLMITIITIIMAWISAYFLYFFVLSPVYFDKHVPVWEIDENSLGDNGYFIDVDKKTLWQKVDSIFYPTSGGSIIPDKDHSWLKVNSEIADGWRITKSEEIKWGSMYFQVSVHADALEDTPLQITVGSEDYLLDETEDSIKTFEKETGLDAEEFLDTVQMIRREYRRTLEDLSQIEYQKVKTVSYKVIRDMSIVWGIWILFCIIVLNGDKIHDFYIRSYEKKLDQYMEEFQERENK